MKYVLVVIYFSAFGGHATGQEAVLTAETKVACEEARAALLKVPGYFADFVLCVPGEAPARRAP